MQAMRLRLLRRCARRRLLDCASLVPLIPLCSACAAVACSRVASVLCLCLLVCSMSRRVRVPRTLPAPNCLQTREFFIDDIGEETEAQAASPTHDRDAAAPHEHATTDEDANHAAAAAASSSSSSIVVAASASASSSCASAACASVPPPPPPLSFPFAGSLGSADLLHLIDVLAQIMAITTPHTLRSQSTRNSSAQAQTAAADRERRAAAGVQPLRALIAVLVSFACVCLRHSIEWEEHCKTDCRMALVRAPAQHG